MTTLMQPAPLATPSAVSSTAPRWNRNPFRRRLNPDHPLSISNLLLVVLAIAFGLLFLLPLMWTITTALKPDADIFKIPPGFFPRSLHFENFIIGANKIKFGQLFANTMFITVISVVGSVFTSMMVGFGLSRIRFPGRRVWFYLFIGSMMLPGIVSLIPLFRLFVALKLIDTWWPLILPPLFGNPFYIFLARQFYMTVPLELDEAAKVDGASYWLIFTRIMLPITRPLWITMAIFAFQASWNEYLQPLVYVYTDSKWTLSMGMASFSGSFAGMATTPWNQYMATNLLYMLPPLLIYFVAQRYFMEGLGSVGATTQK